LTCLFIISVLSLSLLSAIEQSCPLTELATLLDVSILCAAILSANALSNRTHHHQSSALEVTVDDPETPTLNIISPTPRAFTFPIHHSPCSSPSNSPFEPDLRQLTFTPPLKIHTPSSSISSFSSESSFQTTDTALSSPLTTASPSRRRRSTVSEINERRPKKGDEDYIKRPENAFILFRRKCCEDRNLALGAGEAGEGVDGSTLPSKKQRQADLSKMISQQWKGLSTEERQYWEDLAKEKKKEHEQLYPNYVYRPQRVKGKKSAKGKGKKIDEAETDGEGVSIVLPVPALSRLGRRAASAPTPPPAYQQTIQIPTLYMSSTPTSPSMIPMISRRPHMIPPAVNCEYVPSDGFLPPFDQPQGWNPDTQVRLSFPLLP